MTDMSLAEKLMFAGVDTTDTGRPLFTVGETARFFFGRSASWLRWAEYNDLFVLDGVPIEVYRTPAGDRFFTLAVIEQIAYALIECRVIDGERLQIVLGTLRLQGRLHGLI